MAKIPLTEWSRKHKIPQRTAVSWVQNGRLKATKQKMKVKVTQIKTVTGYVIDERTKVPGQGKCK